MNKRQVSLFSTFSNVFLGILKVTVGLAAKSSAIFASGIDSISDILSSFLVYIGIKFSEKESTARYPYGLYRAESIAGFVVFLFVVSASVGIIYESATKLLTGNFEVSIDPLALGVMVISAAVSGLLAYLKYSVGHRQNSTSLIIDSKHSLIDFITSIGVLIGLALSRWNPVFDGILGLIIGIYIIISTLRMTREVLDGLLDTADEESEKKIRKICKDEEIEISSIKSRKVAGKTFVEIEIVLPSNIKIKKADEIIDRLQRGILDAVETVEHVVIQIKGGNSRHGISRDECGAKDSLVNDANYLKDLKKEGVRTVYPYKSGKISLEFGSERYLIIDRKDGKIIFKKVVKNPFFHIGRSHGVRFLRLIKADKIVAANVGENAKKMLKDSNIEVSESA